MQGGQFAPGCSGNPAGMKIGTRHRTARLAQRMMSGDAEDVVKAVVVARPVKALASAGSKWYNTFYTVSGFY
jgi:hypothetical protein